MIGHKRVMVGDRYESWEAEREKTNLKPSVGGKRKMCGRGQHT